MTKTLFILPLALFVAFTTYAQGKNNSLEGVPWNERLVTGGGLGLSFGANQDFVSLSPIIGYALTKKLIAGTGITYRYTKYKNIYGSGGDVTTNDWAINPFARFTVYNGIFIQAEYEYLEYEGFYYPSLETFKDNYSSFMAGGGFLQPIGNNAAFYVMALYNFSYTTPGLNQFSPYYSPWVIRAGISIGGISF